MTTAASLTAVEDEIDETYDVLQCLNMAVSEVETEHRGPLETVLGIALRHLEHISEALRDIEADHDAVSA